MTDSELVDFVKAELRLAVGEKTESLSQRQEEVEGKFRRFMESKALPGFTHSNPEPDSYGQQLAKDAGFRQWLESRSRNHYGRTLRLRETKVITSASGVSLPVHFSGITSAPDIPLRLRSLIPRIPVSSGTIFDYTQGTLPTAAAIQLVEGDKKAEATPAFTSATTKASTIAHFVKCSRQILADVPSLEFWLETQLVYGCLLKEEDVIVNGDPAASINGLLDVAQAVPAGFTPATPTVLDQIGGAIGALLARGFKPDVVIMSGVDATLARMLKDSTGQYLWAMPSGTLSTATIWATQLVVAPSLAAGTALVAALGQSTFLLDRETVGVDIAYENEDDFIRNLVCLRAELRSGLGVPLPSGVLKVTLGAGTQQAAPTVAPAASAKQK